MLEEKELPKITAAKTVYQGKVFDVVKADIIEDGTTYIREIITHNGSSVVLPLFENGDIALVRQYRHPARKFLLECAAGSLEKGETPENGAQRELTEEIGVTARKLTKISEFYVSPGFLSEKMHVFLAEDLTSANQNLDEDEILTIITMPLDEAIAKISIGNIEDAKTIIALIFAREYKLRQT